MTPGSGFAPCQAGDRPLPPQQPWHCASLLATPSHVPRPSSRCPCDRHRGVEESRSRPVPGRPFISGPASLFVIVLTSNHQDDAETVLKLALIRRELPQTPLLGTAFPGSGAGGAQDPRSRETWPEPPSGWGLGRRKGQQREQMWPPALRLPGTRPSQTLLPAGQPAAQCSDQHPSRTLVLYGRRLH